MEKINILIVDDHPMVLEGMNSLLSKFNYVNIAGIATNAFEAMNIIKKSAVQVAIVDNLKHEPRVNIAIEGKGDDGWYQLGKINIIK